VSEQVKQTNCFVCVGVQSRSDVIFANGKNHREAGT